ncbi:histidine--tRNA ligase [Paenibacillus sp. P26]|nr:histidine--tRNA ligase [Paenibacillus sp. P26]
MDNAFANPKGTRDIAPEDQLLRNRIERILTDTFELYGRRPLETPILSYFEFLASKYGGGAEILKEVHRLSDQRGRELALRYDLTMPFIRYVLSQPDLKLPFKRYEIGKVFRDGPVKPGRYREFVQCDVDVVGISSVMAEAELMTMAAEAFGRIGLDIVIEYNNRKLLTGILLDIGIPEEQLGGVLLSLDKLEKMGIDTVGKELRSKGVSDPAVEGIERFVSTESFELQTVQKRYPSAPVAEAIRELEALNVYLDAAGIRERTRFNPYLARGLNIYTGTVYEIFLTDRSGIASSLGSGGRYDTVIGSLSESGEAVPAVGLSFGLDAILAAYKQQDIKGPGSLVEVLVIPLQTETVCFRLTKGLRAAGIRAELEMTGRKLKKALEYANKEGVPFVILIGEEELASGQMTVRDMKAGRESKLPLDDIDRIVRLLAKD